MSNQLVTATPQLTFDLPMLEICKKYDAYGLTIFDLETVRGYYNLPTSKLHSCHAAWAYLRRKEGEFDYESLNASYREKASLYPEFSRVVAASFGWIDKQTSQVRLKSFSGRDERELLEQIDKFMRMLQELRRTLAGMAIVGYDVPLLVKRNLAHGIESAKIIDLGGKKPWEVEVFDLFNIWKMSSFSAASLPMICHCLGIESSKTDEIDGSMVGDLYYNPESDQDENLSKISRYCDRDVLVVAEIVKKIFDMDTSGT